MMANSGVTSRTARNTVQEVVSNPPAEAAVGDGPEVAAQQSRIDEMRAHFAKQPKVRIRIRKEEGDQTVQINGYTFWIKAGERVDVPEQVAQILEDAGLI